jgi:hypothetical protein
VGNEPDVMSSNSEEVSGAEPVESPGRAAGASSRMDVGPSSTLVRGVW